MSRSFAKLFAVAALNLAAAGVSVAQTPAPQPAPSLVGTWVGAFKIVDQKVDVTTTFKADGTYVTTSEFGAVVSVERGKYTFADGVLTTEPDGAFSVNYKVTFDGEKTATFKGNGLTITCKKK